MAWNIWHPHPTPAIVDRVTWQRKIEELRRREKAHTREGDAIAAAQVTP